MTMIQNDVKDVDGEYVDSESDGEGNALVKVNLISGWAT